MSSRRYDTRAGCQQRSCHCHPERRPYGFVCGRCGCRVISDEINPPKRPPNPRANRDLVSVTIDPDTRARLAELAAANDGNTSLTVRQCIDMAWKAKNASHEVIEQLLWACDVCGHDKWVFWDGALGFEGIKCKRCGQIDQSETGKRISRSREEA